MEDEARRAVRQDWWQEALAVTNRILEIVGLLLPQKVAPHFGKSLSLWQL
ncbi:hypothetical protein [Sulfobacillus harzensis]|uniref:Uncharacterized protein n=1 Tax=Sulfobacillus harzensis TaxID=2729629 RepID=A0A7Y0L872_9FIRM|nr:hypothetical protein [Sulfobacillus harzensis]NMP24566.1 hypothetical protein [Sulfobacillus harzensis]